MEPNFNIDSFNLLAGGVSILSFIVSIILYYRGETIKAREEGLKQGHQLREKALEEKLQIFEKGMESALIGLIMNLDSHTYACANANNTHQTLVGMADKIRTQTISLLKTFSDKEIRYPTYSFGINGSDQEEILKNRAKALGLKVEGCIVEGQVVLSSESNIFVQDICIEQNIVSFSLKDKKLEASMVIHASEYGLSNYIRINNDLCLTGNCHTSIHRWVKKAL